ncbi:hypothetical protein pb186bvf_001072 [Paramecium bursaria]
MSFDEWVVQILKNNNIQIPIKQKKKKENLIQDNEMKQLQLYFKNMSLSEMQLHKNKQKQKLVSQFLLDDLKGDLLKDEPSIQWFLNHCDCAQVSNRSKILDRIFSQQEKQYIQENYLPDMNDFFKELLFF